MNEQPAIPVAQHKAKTRLLWVSVASVMVVIVIGWVLTLPGVLSKHGTREDGLLALLRQKFTAFFQKKDTATAANSSDLQGNDPRVQELRGSAFPQFRDVK